MAVTSLPAVHESSFHGEIPWDGVLDIGGQDMAVVGHARGKWRAVVKDVGFLVPAFFKGLSENLFLFPELQDFFFHLGKRDG